MPIEFNSRFFLINLRPQEHEAYAKEVQAFTQILRDEIGFALTDSANGACYNLNALLACFDVGLFSAIKQGIDKNIRELDASEGAKGILADLKATVEMAHAASIAIIQNQEALAMLGSRGLAFSWFLEHIMTFTVRNRATKRFNDEIIQLNYHKVEIAGGVLATLAEQIDALRNDVDKVKTDIGSFVTSMQECFIRLPKALATGDLKLADNIAMKVKVLTAKRLEEANTKLIQGLTAMTDLLVNFSRLAKEIVTWSQNFEQSLQEKLEI